MAATIVWNTLEELYCHKNKTKCWDALEKRITEIVDSRDFSDSHSLDGKAYEIDRDAFDADVIALSVVKSPEFRDSTGNRLSETLEHVHGYQAHGQLIDSIGQKALEKINEKRRSDQLRYANDLERAGRFEEAARFYETWDLFDKAGAARAKGRGVTITTRNISVDINSLLRQIKDGGIVAVYRCPHCGGKIKISKDSNLSTLAKCEHCGTQIEAMDLADFLKTVLS
jgi:DNA-directed RNA polymerase subunit RPC12/RpoP